MASVKTLLEGTIGTITLNCPEQHNAFGADLVSDLLEALRRLVDDGALEVVLRAPRGAKVRSTGQDLNELLTSGQGGSSYDDALRRLTRAVKESPAPIIATVEGSVWDGAQMPRDSGHAQVTIMLPVLNGEARANDQFAGDSAPAVFLANIGAPSEFMARTKYALSVFQAGGFRALTNNGFADGHAAASGFAESDARIAVICSSDLRYEEVAEDTAADLKAAGARTVILVGDPGPKEERYREAGVDRFISTNCDVLGMLRDLHIEEECRTGAIAEFRDVA